MNSSYLRLRLSYALLPALLCAMCTGLPIAHGEHTEAVFVGTTSNAKQPRRAPASVKDGTSDNDDDAEELSVSDTSNHTTRVYQGPDRRMESDAPEQPDVGNFSVSFRNTKDNSTKNAFTLVSQSETIKDVVNSLNSEISLPRNLEVEFTDCSEANAYYDPGSKKVTVCYQLVREVFNTFSEDTTNSKDDVRESTVNVVIFMLFHEIGHALIDYLELPILGREEDVADSVAAILGIYLQEDPQIVADAAVQFASYAEQEDDNGVNFSDEHSASATRAFDTLCLLYGSDPEHFSDMVGDDGLPKARAERCPGEFHAKVKAWEALLGPWMKT